MRANNEKGKREGQCKDEWRRQKTDNRKKKVNIGSGRRGRTGRRMSNYRRTQYEEDVKMREGKEKGKVLR